jgi:hypothetical protein
MTLTESECDRLNEGRKQGVRPYPIVRHCYHCAPVNPPADENGVVHAEDNVSDADEIYLSDDHDVGLTFACHCLCGDLEHERCEYERGGGLLH